MKDTQPTPAQQQHDAQEGQNEGARSALPRVPGHTVPPGRSTVIEGPSQRARDAARRSNG